MNFVTKAMLAPAALLAMLAAPPAIAQDVDVDEPYAYSDDAVNDDEDADDALDDGAIDDEDDVAAAPEDGLKDGAARCAAEFRSFDPGSGTYVTYDGVRRPCPYL